jgi:hypothetical protein
MCPRNCVSTRAVSPNDSIQKLLDAGIDPPLLVDGAQHQLGGFRIEFLVAGSTVDFGGRWEYHALVVFDAVPNDGQIRLEIQFEDPQRLAHVGRGCRNGNQRQDHIALSHVVFDPLLVDRDVAFDEVEAWVAEHRADALGLQVHAVNMPIGELQNVFAQVMADETIDPKNENVFQN